MLFRSCGDDIKIDNAYQEELHAHSSSLDEIVHSEDERVILERNGRGYLKSEAGSLENYDSSGRMPVDTNLSQSPF